MAVFPTESITFSVKPAADAATVGVPVRVVEAPLVEEKLNQEGNEPLETDQE